MYQHVVMASPLSRQFYRLIVCDRQKIKNDYICKYL